MRGGRLALALGALVAVAVPFGAAPALADGTAVTVSGATAGTGTISVSGTIAYGAEATGNLVVATDAAGDAVAPAPGMDLGNLSVRTDVAGKKLIWTLELKNGLPDPIGGPAPAFMGYLVPLMVDDQDFWRWLGAGTAGSALGATGKWTGLCSNETAAGTSGGWGCPGTLAGAGTYAYTGSITANAVSWTQPFNQMKPAIQYGSVIAGSSIHGGAPLSMAWPPGLIGAAAPIDVTSGLSSFKVPGTVTLAIAPTGATPSDAAFATNGTFNGTTGAFAGSLAKPATAGAYTVWAKTCFGLADEPTCVLGSKDITV